MFLKIVTKAAQMIVNLIDESRSSRCVQHFARLRKRRLSLRATRVWHCRSISHCDIGTAKEDISSWDQPWKLCRHYLRGYAAKLAQIGMAHNSKLCWPNWLNFQYIGATLVDNSCMQFKTSSSTMDP
jgi:hypothetical protein